MMPLPQLLDGLGRGRTEVVQKAFSMHHRAFRLEFLRNLSVGALTLAEDHISRMTILFDTVMNYLLKSGRNSSFRQGIINLTVKHITALHQELENTKVNSVSLQQQIAILELLNFHLQEVSRMREESFGRSEGTSNIEKIAAPTNVHLSSASNVLRDDLLSKTDEEVVRHALLSSDAVTSAKQMLLSRKSKTAEELSAFFRAVADTFVYELLQKKQIETAKDVLRNSDQDIWSTLKDICLKTKHSNIRDCLALELSSVSVLEPAEIDAWKFLNLIENILKGTDLQIYISEGTLKKGKLSVGEQQVEVSISALLSLPPRVKASCLSQLYFETLNGTLEPFLDKDECWSHLLDTDQLEFLIRWIKISVLGIDDCDKVDRLATFLVSWNVTQEMIDLIPKSKCSITTKDCLLDFLSKFGLYLTEESRDIHKILLRAIHTSQICDEWDENKKNLFVDFCIKCDMPDLLVSCDIKTDNKSTSWLQLYSLFQTLKNDPQLKRALCNSIEYSASYLNMKHLDNHWIDLAWSLLSYQTPSDTEKLESQSGDKGQHVQDTLQHFPQLLTFLSQTSDELHTDISLQSLLMHKFSSHSSQVLKQDSLSCMFKDNVEESLISFSHEPTIQLHGHNETRDFIYFLKQGRPTHAAMLILADVIRNFGKPSRKLFKRAIFLTYELVFLNMMDQMITSSCIAFLEMLGETSLALRTHLATVNQILSFRVKGSENNQSNNISELNLHEFMAETGALNSDEILEMLLGTLPLDIHIQGLAVQYANLHKLPLPINFLENCAHKNDWISFLVYAQTYGYPPDVVSIAAKQFQSSFLREHFDCFFVRYLKPVKAKNSIESVRNKAVILDTMVDPTGSLELEQPFPISTVLSNEGAMLVPLTKDSLFGVLMACHNPAGSAEAILHACVEMPCPILAVLADFYKANAEAQLVAWLASWLPQEERVNFECWQKNFPWPSDVVESLILRSVEISCSNVLTGFKIFMPEHPLVLILELEKRISSQHYEQNLQSLIMFRQLSLDMRQDETNSGDYWCLKNSSFVFSLGAKVLMKYLECLPSVSDKESLLKVLCEGNIPLSSEGLTFDANKLFMAFELLSSTDIEINIGNFITNSAEEIEKCANQLVDLALFKEASNLSGEKFVIAEQNEKLKKILDTNIQDFKDFCIDCNFSFETASINPLEACNFFQMCAKKLKCNTDKWRALHNALKWMPHSHPNSYGRSDELETDMWQYCMQERHSSIFSVLTEELQHSPLMCLSSTELAIGGFSFTEEFHKCNRSCEVQLCPSRLIDCLLDIGNIVSARRVQNLFQVKHKDLEILLACVHLAEEKLKVQEIPSNWALSSSLKFHDTQKANFISNFSLEKDDECKISSDPSSYSSTEKSQVLSGIQELIKQLKYGKELGKQVVACCRLGIKLTLTYQDVVAVTDPLKLLRIAISQPYFSDFSIVSDIMVALRLSPRERSKFLSHEIIAAISKGPAPGNVKVILLWGHDIQQHFQKLLELVPDPSHLGNDLLNMVNKLVTSNKDIPKAVFNTAVELLVRAHDCFANGCHMEGITRVLRTVSNITPILKSSFEWALLVRLLTGIQRYTEMNYIFKVLKDNDHFEFLLRNDSVKPLGYKVALLDWLRRECPHETALLKMTVAHFQMHQQEAELWQKEGMDRLSDIVKSGLLCNQKTKHALQTAMQDFSHASECYLQADMLNHAMKSAHQAELVALQLHLVSFLSDGNVLCIIMLDPKNVSKLIISNLSFHEALIVARAYNHRVDWAAALFHHCVSPGRLAAEYFSAWLSCMELTPAIVQNIAYRFQRTTGVTKEMTTNMQWLLGHVKDVDVRYKIASELGLKNMVESLLQVPEVAYLKDTVWQCGFKG